MKNSVKIFTIILILIAIFSFCSEDKNPLLNVSHPEDWNVTDSEDFHGKKVLASGYETCKECHGVDFNGGKAEAGCYGSGCHESYPHQPEWSEFNNPNSHGAYIEANMGSLANCKQCHGSNLFGGTSGVSCYACHPGGTLE